MLQDKILALKKEKDVVILAHNYQLPEVQDVADFVGDSLGLSRQAAKTPHKTILFCGVHFMAETAAIICPEKKVLIPDLAAGCSLADSINAEQLREWKKQHPGAIAVGYVNTSADVKAELDYCCTSSNAVNVVKAIPKDKDVLFLPDMFLGSYVAKMTGRKNMYIWAGECHVHAGIRSDDIHKLLDSHAKSSAAQNFVVATETGILYRMQQQNPDKNFIPASRGAVCQYMKMITLDKIYSALLEEKYEVRVPKNVADRARLAINRMLSIS